jgi:parallel beta-helix repeat protein
MIGPNASGILVNGNEADNNQFQVNGTMTSGGIGFDVSGTLNTLKNNKATGNNIAGVVVEPGATGNTFQVNTWSQNGFFGALASSGATGNTFQSNTATLNIRFDLYDNNAPTGMNCPNTWLMNVFGTTGGSGSVCIR